MTSVTIQRAFDTDCPFWKKKSRHLLNISILSSHFHNILVPLESSDTYLDFDFFKESISSCSSCKAWFCLVRILLTDCSCWEACSSSSRLSLVMSLSRFLLSSIYGRKEQMQNYLFFSYTSKPDTPVYLYLCFSISGGFNFVFSLR